MRGQLIPSPFTDIPDFSKKRFEAYFGYSIAKAVLAGVGVIHLILNITDFSEREKENGFQRNFILRH
jgi:hypothetical protein